MVRVSFNLDYRKKKGAFRKLSKAEETRFRSRIEHFEQLELYQFTLGAAKPRRWKATPPDSPPVKLSKDIIDDGLYRINFTNKMRVFAYNKDNVFYIVSVDPDHKSG